METILKQIAGWVLLSIPALWLGAAAMTGSLELLFSAPLSVFPHVAGQLILWPDLFTD